MADAEEDSHPSQRDGDSASQRDAKLQGVQLVGHVRGPGLMEAAGGKLGVHLPGKRQRQDGPKLAVHLQIPGGGKGRSRKRRELEVVEPNRFRGRNGHFPRPRPFLLFE